MHVMSPRFAGYDELICIEYHKMNGVNVGCVFPYHETQRFNSLDTWLFYNNGSVATKQTHKLKQEGMTNQHLMIYNYYRIGKCIINAHFLLCG